MRDSCVKTGLQRWLRGGRPAAILAITALLTGTGTAEGQLDEFDNFFSIKSLAIDGPNRSEIERKLALFDHVGWLDRQTARDEILGMGRRAIPVLLEALRSGSQGRVRNACLILASLEDPVATDGLLELVRRPRGIEAAFAALALGLSGESRARGPIESLLGVRSRPLIARAAAIGLGALGDAASIPALRTLLRRGQTPLRMAALVALGRTGDRAALDAIRTCLAESDDRIRAAATLALADLALESAVPDLLRLAGDEHEPVAVAALLGLARLDLSLRIESLAGRGSSLRRSDGIHRAAILAAGVQKGRDALRLLGALGSAPGGGALPSERLRAAVVLAMGHRTEPEAEHALLLALADPHPLVRRAALAASAIPPVKGIGAAEPLLADRDDSVRVLAARVLALTLGRDADRLLEERAAASTDKDFREAVAGIRGLLRIHDAGGLDLLAAEVQVTLDDLGGSPEWNLLAAENALVLSIFEIEGTFPPGGGGTTPTGTGPRPPLRRFSAEEEDLRVWLDARPFLHRRRARDIP